MSSVALLSVRLQPISHLVPTTRDGLMVFPRSDEHHPDLISGDLRAGVYGRLSAILTLSSRFLLLTEYIRSLVLQMTIARLTTPFSSRSSISSAGPARSATSWTFTTASGGISSSQAGWAANFWAIVRASHKETPILRNATSAK